MINITLICSAGMSTSMLVSKMKDAAKQKKIEVNIRAMAKSAFSSYSEKTDVLLIAPQISFIESELREAYESTGIKIGVIDTVDYGLMNGEKVLDKALLLMRGE